MYVLFGVKFALKVEMLGRQDGNQNGATWYTVFRENFQFAEISQKD
jgi:hypothetical protein